MTFTSLQIFAKLLLSKEAKIIRSSFFVRKDFITQKYEL